MKIRTRISTLGAAALLAIAVVGFTASAADAKPIGPRQTNGPSVVDPIGRTNWTPCGIQGAAVYQPEFDWVFFNPGQNIIVNNVTYTCLTNGNWMNLGS